MLFTFHRLQRSVNVTFICTGKQEIHVTFFFFFFSCDFLDCDVHFIAVMWKQIQYFGDMPIVDCKSHYPKVLS